MFIGEGSHLGMATGGNMFVYFGSCWNVIGDDRLKSLLWLMWEFSHWVGGLLMQNWTIFAVLWWFWRNCHGFQSGEDRSNNWIVQRWFSICPEIAMLPQDRSEFGPVRTESRLVRSLVHHLANFQSSFQSVRSGPRPMNTPTCSLALRPQQAFWATYGCFRLRHRWCLDARWSSYRFWKPKA